MSFVKPIGEEMERPVDVNSNLYLSTVSFITSMTFTPPTGPIIRAVKPPTVVEASGTVTLQPRPQPNKDKKVFWIVVIFVVAVIVVPVTAAVIYALSHGPSGGDIATPSLEITRTLIVDPNGYKFVLTGPDQTVTWTDFTVILQAGPYSEIWDDARQTSLTGNGVMMQALSGRFFGLSTFFVNVTDRGGNGAIDTGDYFTITGSFASGTKYTVALLYEPTKGKMVDTTWTAFASDDSSMTVELLLAALAAVVIVVTVLLLLRRKRGQTKLPLPESRTP